MRNDTNTGQLIEPYFSDTYELYGKYATATKSFSFDFPQIFKTTNNTDTMIQDQLYLQFVVKATVNAQVQYYLMQRTMKIKLNAKHPVNYGGCLSYEVNAQMDRGCWIDYKLGEIKPTLTFKQGY